MQIFTKNNKGHRAELIPILRTSTILTYTIQDRRHQKHTQMKVREQRKMRTDQVLVTSVVPGMADGPTLPSRLGGGGGKLRMSKMSGWRRCKMRG